MPFPWLGRFGSANAGRGDRRRNRRAQQRNQSDAGSPQEAPEVVAERNQRRIGFGIGAFLILVVAGVVGFGYYKEFYSPPRVWAGSVRDVEFTMGDLVSRIRVLQGVNRYENGGQVNLSTVPFEYLQDLVNAEILRQQSPALGIAITGEDIDQELRRQFLPSADPGQETDPGQLDREFNESYGAYLTATGLSDTDFRTIVEEQLAERALAFLLFEQIEEKQPHVGVRWIQLPLDGQILVQDVMRRLENEDFIRVAQELFPVNPFANLDGLVWVPKGAFPEFDDALFGNEEEGIEPTTSGLVPDPIFTSEAYFILNVLSPAEERDLTTIMGNKLLRESVNTWQRETLEAGTEAKTVRMNFNSRLYEWVADQVAVTAPRIERPTPVPEIIPGVQAVPGPGP